MQRRASSSLACLFALAVPVSGLAESAVWRVTGGASSVYLAGTVHKLTPRQYPLPAEYEAVYDLSDVVVFETDIGAMQSPDVQVRLAERSRLPQGETLRSTLSGPAYEALGEYCDEIGFPLETLETLRPEAAMLTLLAVTMQSLGITAPGVDEHFFERARSDSKDTLALESVDKQIELLMSLAGGDPDRFVEQSVDDLREARRGALVDGLQIWRDGEESALIEHFVNDQMLYSPEIYQSLLVDRNREWLHAIRGYIDTPETELVLVGVAHLVGDDSLVALLENEGYELERYSLP